MQKINSIQNYKLVREGQTVGFVTDEYMLETTRIIKLAVNAASDVALYATNLAEEFDPETGELVEDVRLIAFVKAGFEQVEFAYIGNFSLQPVGGDVWLHTFDAGNFEVGKTDYESYARVFEREEEDPVLAQIKYEALQNKRLLQAQMAEARAILAEAQSIRDAANVATPPNPPAPPAASPPTGVAPVGPQGSDGTTQPASGGDGGEPNAGA